MITPNEHFWKVFKETPGALSCAEALAIMNVATQVPYEERIFNYTSITPKVSNSGMILESANLYYEFGSYHGKSAMSALRGLRPGRFMLVDPIFSDTKLSNEVIFRVFDFGKNIAVGTSERTSVEELEFLPTQIKFTYIFLDSGSHGDGLPMQEVKLLEDRLVQGGIIVFHDYKNQFVEVEQAFDYLVSTGKYEPIHINWHEIFDYVLEHNLEEGNNSWHQYPDLPHPPNFVGALIRR